MKKTLTALFIGSCFMPVVASAAVDIYGRIHMSVDYYDNASGADAKDMISVNSNASRIGFRGGDELAHGLKAEWQIESGINLPTSGSLWASRNSFVGIVGDFGRVRIGKHDTPFKVISRTVDFFDDQVGDLRNLIKDGGAGFDRRPDNVIVYMSPVMSGAEFAATYETTATKTAVSASAVYKMDRSLYVAAGYEVHAAALGGGAENESAMRLAASYTLGDIKFAGLYHHGSNLAGVNDKSRSLFGGGVAYTLGVNTFKAQYYMASDLEVTPSAPDTGGSVFAVGLDHALSKATRGYVALGVSMNDDNTKAFSPANSGHDLGGLAAVANKGDGGTNLSVGILHNF